MKEPDPEHKAAEPAAPADEVKAEPLEHKAGFYYDQFTVQLFEEKNAVGLIT